LSRSCCVGVVADMWKRARSPPVLKNLRKEGVGKQRLVILSLSPGEVMEEVVPKALPSEGEESDGELLG